MGLKIGFCSQLLLPRILLAKGYIRQYWLVSSGVATPGDALSVV